MQTLTPVCLIVAAAATLSVGCRQEQKHVRVLPPGGGTGRTVQQSDLQPGPAIPARRAQNPFEGNAHAIAEGKKLYNHYNCSGCHANGGGAIGPPFIDDEWIYGQSAEAIFAVIVEGRPQGMPAFGGRVPEYQVWQIVSYVRSMADLAKGTAPEPVAQEAQQQRSSEVKQR
jgi:cytochrome c oxidase cbb3-type subunit III